MSAIEHYHEILVYQQVYVAHVVHSSRVCCIFGVDGREKLHSHHAASIVVVIDLKLFGQCATVCHLYSAEGYSGPRFALPSHRVRPENRGQVSSGDPNSVFNVIRHREVTIRAFLL